MPAWLIYALLAILCWGAWGVQSKLLMGYTSPYTGQVQATLGLFLPAVLVLFSSKRFAGQDKRRGLTFAVLTGLLGGLGNIAFYMALVRGKASIVVPLTSMSPLVTVALAVLVLREKLKRHHYVGIGLAMVAIYLLSL
jgi:transporter family protein